jgi:hypothetical protein
MSSKKKVDDGGVLTHAALVAKVFEVYTRSVHYKSSDKVKNNVLASTKDIPLNILQQAFKVWNDKGKERKKAYHPNYFLAVARRLHENAPDNNITSVWGKGI